MILPVQFDQNEWFLIVMIILSYTVVFLMPKRIPWSQFILVMLLSVMIARLSDHLLASPSVDLYDINDTGKYDLFDFVTYLLYAPFSYLFIYFYDRFNIRGIGIVLYIVVCSFLGMLFEMTNALFEVFHYKGWSAVYSFSVYLVSQSITLLLFSYIRTAYHTLLRNQNKKWQGSNL
ncbi:hypothetical protein NC797_15270 [Aquibacillus sp. 3ASR75-11]|uniref:Uncharacterized protein n=1 Tax=Terrihalobacillus insolitus TaxID=2950438 RepID=A0A9X3WWJ9_9BACI|nr:hypothetical protein [Terrihalobacillus insolitus]MDC3414997.1 hypothetical protein [Terrihalobacillus insolitus]MDC3425868.1 hypothetical protein [Terrihalobacillus insolitus]